MNSIQDEQISRSIDSLLNYETVKYNGGKKYETEVYREAISNYQKEEYMSIKYSQLKGIGDVTIINISLLAGTLYCIYLITMEDNKFTPGHFVPMVSCIYRPYYPLNRLRKFYQ